MECIGKKRCLVFGILLLAALPVVLAIAGNASQADVKAAVKGNSEFALNLFKELAKKEGNIFISPFSVSTALSMLYEGARDDTEKEMKDVMKVRLYKPKLHAAMAWISSSLANQSEASGESWLDEEGEKKFEFTSANGLWIGEDYSSNPDFVEVMKKYYKAEDFEADFSDREDILTRINKWVNEKSRGKITKFLSKDDIEDEIVLALINTIYFKGQWGSSFREDGTETAAFHVSKSNTVKVPMMRQKAHLAFLDGSDFKAVSIPYLSCRISFLVLVPDDIEGLEAFVKSLTPEKLQKCFPEYGKGLDFYFPKFGISGKYHLKSALRGMGMKKIFSRKESDLSGLADPLVEDEKLFVSRFIHQVQISVDEKGTEATAASGALTAKNGRTPVEFKVDRPFLFLIRDNKTGTILFMGRVMDPSK
ncbi:MAG: serpin family protein [Planctomycetota bacterium]|jgi:serpin B